MIKIIERVSLGIVALIGIVSLAMAWKYYVKAKCARIIDRTRYDAGMGAI